MPNAIVGSPGINRGIFRVLGERMRGELMRKCEVMRERRRSVGGAVRAVERALESMEAVRESKSVNDPRKRLSKRDGAAPLEPPRLALGCFALRTQ
jgi:hypothetical protein